MAGGTFLGGGVAQWGTRQPVYEKKYCWGFRSFVLLMRLYYRINFAKLCQNSKRNITYSKKSQSYF